MPAHSPRIHMDMAPHTTNSVNAIVTRNKMHVSTGIIGAKAMFPALTAAGRTDVGVALVEQVG